MSNMLIVDVEADGPIPGDYSMVSFGAIIVTRKLEPTFFSGILKPLPQAKHDPETVKVHGITREQQSTGKEPLMAMNEFAEWLKTNMDRHPILWSDNNQFDGMFMAWYFHHFLGYNPLGWSSRRIGDLYCGHTGNLFDKWKHLRITQHSHNPIDDAKGNAEALLTIIEKLKMLG